MTLYGMRKKFNGLSLRVGKMFRSVPITPNTWTLLALVVAFSGFLLVAGGKAAYGAIVISFASFIDIIDGAVARETGKSTNFGAFLDTVTDKYIEFFAIISLLFVGLPKFIIPSYVWVMILAFGCLMTSFAKAASAEKNVVSHKDGHGAIAGILDHTDRLLLIILAILLSPIVNRIYITYMVAVLSVLANYSALQRIKKAKEIWDSRKIK